MKTEFFLSVSLASAKVVLLAADGHPASHFGQSVNDEYQSIVW